MRERFQNEKIPDLSRHEKELILYTLVRKEEKKKRKYEYTFYLREKAGVLGSTNYRRTAERFEWKVVGDHVWEWKQRNRNYRILEYIPIINTIKAAVVELKYGIYKDGKEVGEAYFQRLKKNRNERDIFIINGRKYFCCQGNTDFIRPFKKYEWTIENTEHEVAVSIKKDYEKSIYRFTKLDPELDIELAIFPIMHKDMAVFSREGREMITDG